MELEAEFGERIRIERDSIKEIGRDIGLVFGRSSSNDRTVSRRHLSLRLLGKESKLHFEVTGRNPIVVFHCEGGGKRIYRNSEKGELGDGDHFSLSVKNPSFFVLRKVGEEKGEIDKAVLDAVERREKRTLERRREKEETARMEIAGGEGDQDELELDIESLDISHIDPVEEFGFLVRGHEFDKYPRKKIHPMKDWNWFLEVVGRNSDDEEDEVNDRAGSPKGKGRRRKEKGEEGEDEDWTGEREEERDFVAKGGSAKRPKYATRSKDCKRQRNEGGGVQGKKGMQHKVVKDHINEEDEEDETLGGFIVNNDEEEVEEEEESGEDEEEEEEFVEEEEDDE